MDITSLKAEYDRGIESPCAVVAAIYDEIDRAGQLPVWISLVDRADSMKRARDLEADPAARTLPLYGIPFAVKDNFDVAQMQTTAACPAFARTATETATVIQRLLDAGAILIGKTNMDQFATGLVGTRSPYGVCSCVFDQRYISGAPVRGPPSLSRAAWSASRWAPIPPDRAVSRQPLINWLDSSRRVAG